MELYNIMSRLKKNSAILVVTDNPIELTNNLSSTYDDFIFSFEKNINVTDCFVIKCFEKRFEI